MTGVPPVYASLQRLREHSRIEAHQQVRAAEVERDRSVARLDELRTGVDVARSQVDFADADALGTYQAFRLQEGLRERREQVRLAQRERELETRRTQHVRCVRDELTLEALVEEMHALGELDVRRGEARQMDEIASLRRKI